MDALNEHDIEEIVVMSSAQIGKTEFLLNMIGYHVDQDPAPILCLQPTLDMAQTFSKDRLAPMIRDCPSLTEKIADVGSKKGGNTLLKKDFPGGHCTLAGANSPASLASRPVRLVLCDEIDRYPASAGTEGDPVNLARKRTATFWNRKVVLVSTPTEKGISRIEKAYDESDQRRYNLPCPHCGELHHLKWANVVFNKDDVEAGVTMVCPKCGGIYTEADKVKMLQLGEWIAENEGHKRAGFHINELYSPWRKWEEVVVDFLEAKGSPETLKTWVNTSLGETFEEEGEKLESNSLYMRREHYLAEVPKGGVVLTCSVDVQDDRLEAQVVAWGEGFESWQVKHEIFWGDPGRAELWKRLDEFLLSSFEHESGAKLRISTSCIDSGGHYTDQVYKFVKTRSARRIYAIKGSSMTGAPILSRPSKRNKAGINLFSIGVSTAKEVVVGRLQIAETGPGYCHFPQQYDEEWFEQLTSEKRITKYVKGRPTKQWVQTRPRNEAFDCAVYNVAAVELLNPDFIAIGKRMVAPEEVIEKPPSPVKVAVNRRKKRTTKNKNYIRDY